MFFIPGASESAQPKEGNIQRLKDEEKENKISTSGD